MHILKIIHGYPPNYNAGSEVYSQSVCNELSKKHKVSVFTREENPYEPDFGIRQASRSMNPNLIIYYVNNPQGKDGYQHKLLDDNFADLLKKIKPDIAHIGHLNHLSTGIVDELNKLGIPIVFTLHDFWLMCPRGQFLTRGIGKANNYEICSGQEDKKCADNCYKVYYGGREEHEQQDRYMWSTWIHHRMDETKAIIDKVDLFFSPSLYLRNRFITDFGVPPNKIIYLDYGFPTEYLKQTTRTSVKNNYTFGYIGTLIPAKGVNQLIEAFNLLDNPATLKIFGRENGQSSQALRQLAKVSSNTIEFAGEYINHNLANDVFSKVDCIVVPSIWAENSPLVIHEAQACKIPVITADYGGMSEYVQHQVNGLLFSHRNPQSMAEQMQFAVENPDIMKKLGEKGYLFSPDGTVPDIEDHCNTLVRVYNQLQILKKFWRITIDTNPEDCNLRCIMCEEHSPYSDFKENLLNEIGIKSRRMKFETVNDIIGQAAKLGVREIIPSTMGEPLLYKEFEKVIHLAAKHGIKINLTTNGTFPNRKIFDWARIIIPNTSDIKISWNGATKETAERIMTGINFESTLQKVKELIGYRNDYFASAGYYCRITFQLTFMQNNIDDLPDIIKLAANLGVDRIKGHQLWTHFNEIKGLSMKTSVESIEKWNNIVRVAYKMQEIYRKPNGDKVIFENISPLKADDLSLVPEHYECPFLGQELWISATGKISPCCAPDKLRQTLGNFGSIEDRTLKEILASHEYNDLLVNYKSKPLCKTCNMRKPLN